MRKHKLLTVFSLFVFAFLFIPLFIIVMTAFSDTNTIIFPIKGFTFKWFSNVFAIKSFMESFKISFLVSIVATIVALIVGIPAAYALSRFDFKGKKMVKSFFLSPTIVPGIVLGFALFRFIVVALKIEVFSALILGHFLIILPYIIRVVGSSLEQFDFSVEEAAWSLGCGKNKTFFTIVMPNISSGIIAACMMGFINSFNNIPLSMFLAGPGVTTLPSSLLSYIEYSYNPTVSAVSVLMMVITAVIIFGIEKTLGLGSASK